MAPFHYVLTPPSSPASAFSSASTSPPPQHTHKQPSTRLPPPARPTPTPLRSYSFPQFFTAAAVTGKTRRSSLYNDSNNNDNMHLRIDTIQSTITTTTTTTNALLSPAVLSQGSNASDYDSDDNNDPSWSTPSAHYNLDRAAAIAAKIAQEELALLAPAAPTTIVPIGMPFEVDNHQQQHQHQHLNTKAVRFTGLYVVNGPPNVRHLRYAMDVTLPELQLRTQCIQRFQRFYDLRKRLLRTTKRCRYVQHQLTFAGTSAAICNGNFKLSRWTALRELPKAMLRTARCSACRRVHRALHAIAFPRRTLLATMVVDVQARSIALETFLNATTRLLVDWPGCDRGRKLVANVLGTFLGVNILQTLYPSQFGRGSSYAIDDEHPIERHVAIETVRRSFFGASSSRRSTRSYAFAQSATTSAISSLSSSGCSSSAVSTGDRVGSVFFAGVLPEHALLLSARSSTRSSLSLHDDSIDGGNGDDVDMYCL